MAYLIELILGKAKKGIQAISLVKSPAILTNFIALAKDPMEKSMKLAVDTDKHIVLGPALIPNVKIFRSAKSLGLEQDAYVYFTADTIKEISEIYLATLKNNEVTLDHEEDTDDVKMIESWIVEDSEKDKSALYGFDLPVGTWCVAFKIQNEDLWKQIKDGDLQGFSIEAAALTMIPKGEFSFATELVIEPKVGEDKDTFSSRCIAAEIDNYYPQEQAAAICYSKWDESQKLEEDKREVLPDEEVDFALEQLFKVGIKEEEFLNEYEIVDLELSDEDDLVLLALAIESDPNASSFLDKEGFAVRYKYVGPRDEKNRKFCANVLDANLIYRKEDINMMSFRGENTKSPSNPDGINKINYSIFDYKGSFNCRHSWKRLIFKKKEGELKKTTSAIPYDIDDTQATKVNDPVKK